MKDSYISWVAVILTLWNFTIGLELRVARNPRVSSPTRSISWQADRHSAQGMRKGLADRLPRYRGQSTTRIRSWTLHHSTRCPGPHPRANPLGLSNQRPFS